MAYFVNVEVFPISLPFVNGKTYQRTPKCNWCNADSVYHVKRTSVFSGLTLTDYACECCAKGWQEQANNEKKENPA